MKYKVEKTGDGRSSYKVVVEEKKSYEVGDIIKKGIEEFRVLEVL